MSESVTGPITTFGSTATASASACFPATIVLNTRVTGVTVRVLVPTVPELATSTVNVVLVAPTEIAVIFAEAPTLVPAILSPTSARPPNAAFAATIVNAPEAPLLLVQLVELTGLHLS